MRDERPLSEFLVQDGGNTNYSVAIPRTSFDRRTNAEVVARGLNTLGVSASVNERNDVVVDKFKMSWVLHMRRSLRLTLPLRVGISVQNCEQEGISSWDHAYQCSAK